MHDDAAEEFALWKEEVIIILFSFLIHNAMMLDSCVRLLAHLAFRTTSQRMETHNSAMASSAHMNFIILQI